MSTAVTLSITCSHCRRPVVVTYVADPDTSSDWLCPYSGCAKQQTLTGASLIVGVVRGILGRPEKP